MYRRILSDPRIEFPANVASKEFKDLLVKLLRRDPKRRIGFDAIRQHPFFACVDWLELMKKAVPGPIVPKLHDDEDVSAFDTSFTSMTPGITPVADPTASFFQRYLIESKGSTESLDYDEPSEEEDFFTEMIKRQTELRVRKLQT